MMLRLALLLVLLLASGHASAGIQYPPSSSASSGTSSFPTGRPPASTDDTSLGYTTTSTWSYGSDLWQAINVGTGTANWQMQPAVSAPTCDLVPTCKAAYGVYKLRAAYSGNAFEITRASDSTTLAVPFETNGIASWSAVDAFCQGTSCVVDTWYDQSGNGYDLTQATSGKRPPIYGAKIANLRAITFDGNNGLRTLSNASMPITDRRNMSVLMVASTLGNGGNALIGLYDVGTPTQKFTLFGNQGPNYNLAYNAGSGVSFGIATRASVGNVFLTVATSGAVSNWQNNKLTANGSISSSAATGVLVGSSSFSSTGMMGDMAAYVVWDSALSTANQTLALQSTYQSTGIQPQVTDVMAFVGDSITCCTITGAGGYGLAPDSFMTFRVPKLIARPYNYYNFGFPGQTLQTMVGQEGTVAGLSFQSGANNIAVVFGGTNDIAANDTGANVYGYYQTICTSYRASGFKCVVVTTLPRNGLFSNGQNAAGFETQRQILNTSLRSNWATFADGIIDAGSDPTMGPQAAASNSALYGDGVHPTSPLGTSYLAAIYARGLKPLVQ